MLQLWIARVDAVTYRRAILLFALQVAVPICLLDDRFGLPTFEGYGELIAFVPIILGTVPFGLILPSMRAGHRWGMPSQTFMFSRHEIQIACSAGVGMTLGLLTQIPFVGWPLIPMLVAASTLAISLVAATHRRFRRHAATEWIRPNPALKVFAPIIRGLRPDEESS
ncbi:MAG: hypothetical protein AAF802_09110 [Planctomycetota bacterium]